MIKMVKIAYINIAKIVNPFIEQSCYELIPESMKIRIKKYRNIEDRFRGLMGKLLAKKLLMEYGNSEKVLEDIELDKYNRPFLRGEIDFNISHSGDIVLCGISKKNRLGIDVEEMNKLTISEYDWIFNDSDRLNLASSENKLNTFYEIWCKKEAVAKAVGKGFSEPVASIQIKGETAILKEEKWHLKQIDIEPNHKAYIALKNLQEYKIEEIKIDNLISK